jgi:hypothetical protein
MKRKPLMLLVVLISFCVFLSSFSRVNAVSGSLIDNLTTLVNLIDWSDAKEPGLGYYTTWDIDRWFIAYSFGIITKSELDRRISRMQYVATGTESASAALSILYGYTETMKYGIENETAIKWALNNITIMNNGLPYIETSNSKQAFHIGHRYALMGYYFAEKYSYLTGKWNKTKAYLNFKWALDHSSYPVAFYVYYDNTTYSGTLRYYDESAETIDAYLRFYELGIPVALDDAVNVWNWINNNLWSTNYYKYTPGSEGYECEFGNFIQIIKRLQKYAPNAGNYSRLETDLIQRFLSNTWLSPQWSIGTTKYYAVVHMNPLNNQRRLGNTFTSWLQIYGDSHNFSASVKTSITSMLKGYEGYDAAWKLLYNSTTGFYNTTSGLFHGTNEDVDRWCASAFAAHLLFNFGIVPNTATLAIPISDFQYEDRLSQVDYDLFNIAISTRQVTLAILYSGTVDFQFGTTIVTQNFNQSGVWLVQFASNWNSISSVTRLNDLPSDRLYYETPEAAPEVPAPEVPEGFNLSLIPIQLAAALGISEFAAQILLAIIILLSVMLPTLVLTRNILAHAIVGMAALLFCSALGWFPYWAILLIVIVVGLLFAGSVRNMISGKGGEG